MAATGREIQVDDRIGSRELLPELKKLHLPCTLTRLKFGDVAFTGQGKRDEVKIGIERKTINDLINSFVSGRLSAHQLPGLIQTYDYRWIIIEGLWRPGADNRIEVWRWGGWQPANTRVNYWQLAGYRLGLEVNGGCWTMKTANLRETATEIGIMFQWWGKSWSRHRSHLVIEKGLMPDRILFSKPTYPRLVAAVLPGVGWEKSRAVAKHFHTVEAMVEAGPEEWMKVPGIGKTLGLRLPMILQGVKGVEGSREP